MRWAKKLHVAELRISPASALAGKSLAESEVGGRYGVTILGLWERGHLRTDVGPDTRLEPGSILIAAGADDHLNSFGEAITASDRVVRRGRFIIGGLGEVGEVAREILSTVGEEVVAIDRRAHSGADIIGDFLDPEVIKRAEPTTASAILLALDQDAATLFAALVVRDVAPQVPIIARVNEAANVQRIHLAGADFALSISQVAGQILGHQILDQESISVEPGLRVSSLPTAKIAGRALGELSLRKRSGCSIVAIERGEDLLVQLDESTRIEAGDRLFVCGATESIRKAAALFGAKPPTPATR